MINRGPSSLREFNLSLTPKGSGEDHCYNDYNRKFYQTFRDGKLTTKVS